MVNCGPLASEICCRVVGTPTNFNGFRLFATLLRSTLVVGVSKLCGVEQTAPLIFGRAAITLGIGPHSSFILVLVSCVYVCMYFSFFCVLCLVWTECMSCHISHIYGQLLVLNESLSLLLDVS